MFIQFFFLLVNFVTATLCLDLVSPAAKMPKFTYERLNKSDAALIILDMQEGLFSLARDYDATLYRNAMYAHAELGKNFGIPVIMSTSAEVGPNGPLPNEFLEMYPDVQVVKRQGEVNAMDNEKFRAAVKATGKSQIILAGIVTDVCKSHHPATIQITLLLKNIPLTRVENYKGTAFCALSLREAGYSVWANHEASGTTSVDIREQANARMRDAGVQVVSYFAIVCELMRDWRNTPGAAELFPVLDRYLPAYGMIARGHLAAIKGGVIQPGEEALP
ncbi:Isochorismatase hydrolase [Xylariaceae sp. FL0594]|nr:Isochorismatase hydrolase [Xylariaceae sp. FL0594]